MISYKNLGPVALLLLIYFFVPISGHSLGMDDLSNHQNRESSHLEKMIRNQDSLDVYQLADLLDYGARVYEIDGEPLSLYLARTSFYQTSISDRLSLFRRFGLLDLTARDEKGRSPLHVTRDATYADFFISHGNPLDANDAEGETPLSRALMEIVTTEFKTPIRLQLPKAEREQLEKTEKYVLMLLKWGAQISNRCKVACPAGSLSPLDVYDSFGNSVLHATESPALAAYYLARGVPLNYENEAGATAAYSIPKRIARFEQLPEIVSSDIDYLINQIELLDLYLRWGMDIHHRSALDATLMDHWEPLRTFRTNVENDHGLSLPHIAVFAVKHPRVLSFLETAGFDLGEVSKTRLQTPLQSVIDSNHWPLASWLVSRYSDAQLLNKDHDGGNTALHRVLWNRGHPALVRSIAQRLSTKELGVQNKNGESALHIGANNGDLPAVQELVLAGAPLENAPASDPFRTPLVTAIQAKDSPDAAKIADYLRAHGANDKRLLDEAVRTLRK